MGDNRFNKRVMLVEGDPVIAKVLLRAMHDVGFETFHCYSAEDAIAELSKKIYHIIVSDSSLSGTTAFQLCRHVRETSHNYAYFIMLSSHFEKNERLEAYSAGVDDHIIKPLDRDEFLAKLSVANRIVQVEETVREQNASLEEHQRTLKMANQSLMFASRRFEELFAGLPSASFTFDIDGKVHEWNRCAESLFSIQMHEIFDLCLWEVFQESGREIWNSETVLEVVAGNEVKDYEWVYHRADGETFYLVCNIIPLTGGTGQVIGAISTNTDITDRKLAEAKIENQMRQINKYAKNLAKQTEQLRIANEQLEKIAESDGLTGLYNHRRMYEILEEFSASKFVLNSGLSAILMDVDSFKLYNDKFGHLEGDEVLRRVATHVSKVTGERGMAARYGGEEFAVLLPGCDEKYALAIAEEIRKEIESAVWTHRAITVSVGVATTHHKKDAGANLMRHADEALYRAKQTGKNRSVHYSSMSHDEALAA